MSVGVMTVGVMSVEEITVGVMTVRVMRRPQIVKVICITKNKNHKTTPLETLKFRNISKLNFINKYQTKSIFIEDYSVRSELFNLRNCQIHLPVFLIITPCRSTNNGRNLFYPSYIFFYFKSYLCCFGTVVFVTMANICLSIDQKMKVAGQPTIMEK